ncbi:MAG: 50S ribosomal protein L29 [Candidatus Jacksonbacteria bacterium]
MDLEVLKKMSINDLQSMLMQKKEELMHMRFKADQRQLKHIRQIRNTKQNIAQILTIISDKKHHG